MRNSADIHRGTPCIFTPPDTETDLEPGSFMGVGEETCDSLLNSVLSEQGILFSAWVNQVSRRIKLNPPFQTNAAPTDPDDCVSTASLGNTDAAIQTHGVCN